MNGEVILCFVFCYLLSYLQLGQPWDDQKLLEEADKCCCLQENLWKISTCEDVGLGGASCVGCLTLCRLHYHFSEEGD